MEYMDLYSQHTLNNEVYDIFKMSSYAVNIGNIVLEQPLNTISMKKASEYGLHRELYPKPIQQQLNKR